MNGGMTVPDNEELGVPDGLVYPVERITVGELVGNEELLDEDTGELVGLTEEVELDRVVVIPGGTDVPGTLFVVLELP